MPQAATLPTTAHTRRTVRHVPIEERVAVLETHAPTVATKADVRGAENRMILWILGAALALAGFCFALFSASEGRMDKRLDVLDTRMDRLDSRIDKLEAKLDARIDKLDARMDRLDAKFDAMMAELRSQRRAQQ